MLTILDPKNVTEEEMEALGKHIATMPESALKSWLTTLHDLLRSGQPVVITTEALI